MIFEEKKIQNYQDVKNSYYVDSYYEIYLSLPQIKALVFICGKK